ncbi:MAG: hypothetical protein Q8942_20225 [Bacillota bacterium]|nr:hypothetical protein [Bacillota bacterium]
MSKIVKAKVNWVSDNDQIQPIGKHVTAARFEDVKGNWPSEAWSVLADFSETNNKSIIDLNFLFEWAPENLIYSGSRFDLFEGNCLVATGEILG